MFLEAETFRVVVANTPLISIDLIVRNNKGKILLGKRLNRPAQGYWFVPGGRVYKDESLDDAFERLTQAELGRTFHRIDASMLGVYEHFYEDNVFAHDGVSMSTHYVVLCYRLILPPEFKLELPVSQHEQYKWWAIDDLITDPDVHIYTRTYF